MINSVKPLGVQDDTTRSLLFGLWRHLCLRRRLQLGLLLLLMLASGVAEIISLGLVLPFLTVLSEPERIWQMYPVHILVNSLRLTSASELVPLITLIFVLSVVSSSLIRLSNSWLSGRLAAAVGSDLSCEAYRRTLLQPYRVHIRRNSSSIITAITSHIGGVVSSLSALLQFVASVVVAIGLLVGLVIINVTVALSSAFLFGSVYLFIAHTTHKHLRRNSHAIASSARQQIQCLQEGLGAIRDILLDSNYHPYIEIYSSADRTRRRLQATNQFLGLFPRYVLEAVGLIAIALITYIQVLNNVPFAYVIPFMGAIALGAQRLLPALQNIYVTWAVVKASNPSLKVVLEMLDQPLPSEALELPHFSHRMRNHIVFDSVFFSYDDRQTYALKNINVEIARGQRIGLIGPTGSGKSTIADLLMTLLVPTMGRILVDGLDLHDPVHASLLPSWRASIAHVPQSIFLADASVARNIAFGVSPENIDMRRVIKVAQQAQIANLIDELPHGYQTFVGERGIRLSGGQRQRLGIARALYKQADIMILDEATAALDNETEQAVIEAVESLSKDLTIFVIAHRLTTVQRCDRVIRLVDGCILADGPAKLVLASD